MALYIHIYRDCEYVCVRERLRGRGDGEREREREREREINLICLFHADTSII